MAGLTLRARLLIALGYVLLLAILALLVPLIVSVRERVDEEVESQSRGQAEFVAATAADSTRPGDLVRAAARQVRGRVILVDAQGRLLEDSEGEERAGADYSTRPEVAAALDGRAEQTERDSETLDRRLLATAVPVLRRGQVDGAVRITQSVEAVDDAVWRATLGLALVGGVVLLVGLGAGAVLAEQTARPLRRLDAVARRIAGGDLSARARLEGSAEQRSLARTFNDMTARLEALVRSQRDFIADASHQLRTPLAGMRLRLEEIEATTDDASNRRDATAALTELDRLNEIVRDLLELSQAGERDSTPEAVDLEAAAERASERWAAQADLRIERDGTPRRVRAAGEDVDRVLDVLLENALHYGAPPVVLRVNGGALEVLDDGPGPAAGEEELVFERFHRGEVGRAGAPGTGLGLAIARAIARRWGGDVTLSRRTDGGACASLRLPLADA